MTVLVDNGVKIIGVPSLDVLVARVVDMVLVEEEVVVDDRVDAAVVEPVGGAVPAAVVILKCEDAN